MINLDGDNIEVVERFSYLDDVISTKGGAQETVTSRTRSALKKFEKGFEGYMRKKLIQKLCEKCFNL